MAPDALCIIVKVLLKLCKQLFQRRKLQARTEDLHRLLKLRNRRERRGDADVGVLRADAVGAGGHNGTSGQEQPRAFS